MAGQIKVDSINADSNLALKIANTAVAFIDSSGLRPISGNVNLDATATSKLYLPSANTVAIQTAGVTAVTVDSSQNVTLAGTLTTTGITNSGVATATRFNPTGSSVTGNGMYLPAANSLGLSTNGNNAVYIDSSQNVGIGTASPGNKLTVVSTGNIAAQVTGKSTAAAFSSSTFWDGTGGGLQITNSETTTNAPTSIRFTQTGSTDAVAGIAAVFSSISASNLVFCTNNGGVTTPERMRIDSNGNLLVGTTSVTPNPGVSFQPAGNITVGNSAASTGHEFHTFRRSAVQIGSITQSGTTAVAYNTSSDYRLKNTIAPMTGALGKVALLKPVTYKWNADNSDGQGFIAHELQAVVPDCVTGKKDAVDAEGNPVHQGIDTSFLVATLTAAIQELKAIVDAQAVRIAALEV